MDEVDAAAALAALGHPARLHVFRLLVQAGPAGLNAGALAEATGMPASTLAHHVKALAAGGLARQERRGRETLTRADHAALTRVFAFVEENCCAGVAPPAAMETSHD